MLPAYIRGTVIVLLLILAVYVLVKGRDFLYPLAFAVLFAYLLYPVAKLLEKIRLPAWLAALGAVLLGVALFSLAIFLLYSQLGNFWQDLPVLQQQAFRTVDELESAIEQRIDQDIDEKGWLRQRMFDLIEGGDDMVAMAFSATTGTLVKIFLMPVYTFFMLLYRRKFKAFFLETAPDGKREKAHRIVEDASRISRRYVTGLFIVVLILAVLNTVGLLLIGVQYALLLGILSATVNFIPYIGTWIGGSLVILVTLLSGQPPQKALIVFFFFLGVNFLENNVLTPNIVGGQVNINPLFALLSIVAGSMIWGLPGMFTAIPFLAMGKVVCDHVGSLKPLGRLLEGN